MSGEEPQAPGWHTDPRAEHELRYWDGSVWTDHVLDPPPPSATGSAEAGASGDGVSDGAEADAAWTAGVGTTSSDRTSAERRAAGRDSGTTVAIACWLVLLGAALLVLGSLMPWVVGPFGLWASGGPWVPLLGLVAGGLTLPFLLRDARRIVFIAPMAAAVVLAGSYMAVFLIDHLRTREDLEVVGLLSAGDSLSLAYGFWLAGVGVIVSLGGATVLLLSLLEERRT